MEEAVVAVDVVAEDMVAVDVLVEGVVLVVVAEDVVGEQVSVSRNLSFWHGVNCVESIATLMRFLKIIRMEKNIKRTWKYRRI